MHKGKAVLIVSYETQRLYSKLFENHLKNTNNSSSHNINSSKQKKRTTITTTITTKSSNDEIVGDDLNKADGIHKGDDHITITNKSNDDDGDGGDNNQHNDGFDHDDDHCAYYKELLQFHSNNSVCDLLICDEVRWDM